jgi:hypothetical protein
MSHRPHAAHAHTCTRCRGRLVLEYDPATGDEYVCLACGRRTDAVPVAPLAFVTRLGPAKQRHAQRAS